MHSRRLTFVVGTSLLTASLATTGCGKQRVNTRPPEQPHVNEGPTAEPDAEQPDAETPDAEQPDGPPPEDEPHVNTVPSAN